MTDQSGDEIDREWKFDRGDLIADEMPQHTRMPGVAGVESGPEHDYEVIKRMFDADDGAPMYLVEKPKGDQLVYTATTLRLNFEKVGEADDAE